MGTYGRPSSRPTREVLERMVRAHPAREVHVHVGVARDTLVRWCKELGVEVPRLRGAQGAPKGENFKGTRSRRPDPETWTALCAKHTCVELQEQFEVTYWTIWAWCREVGIPVPQGRSPGRPKVERAPRQTREAMPATPDRLIYWCQRNIPFGGAA